MRGAGDDIARAALTQPLRASELASTAYELGLAFATGKAVVVITNPGEKLPFDVDLNPVEFGSEADASALLDRALDDALYIPQRGGKASSLPTSLAHLSSLLSGHPRRLSFEAMGWLDESLTEDPAGFAAIGPQLLRSLPHAGLCILHPAWPGAYPSAAERRCFHVMPFTTSWSAAVRDTLRDACVKLGISYERGDMSREGRIIHAIWNEICRAHLVVVDVTGGNLNVLIELGMVHALGRASLVVRNRGEPHVRVPSLDKVRTLEYGDHDELHRLFVMHLEN
jgi:hypothetical protein